MENLNQGAATSGIKGDARLRATLQAAIARRARETL
jgi:hypothetical protein